MKLHKTTPLTPPGIDTQKLFLFVFIFQTDSFFPAMRMVLPQLDKERAAYGMKEVFQLLISSK